MKHIIPCLLFITILGSNSAIANCPPPNHVVYKCVFSMGNRHCSWTTLDGWYEGTDAKEDSIKPGSTADHFVKALWFPYSDDMHGATDCYYSDANSFPIKLFQQSGYGTVSRPTEDNWRKGWMPNFRHAVICTTSSYDCHFNYGGNTP